MTTPDRRQRLSPHRRQNTPTARRETTVASPPPPYGWATVSEPATTDHTTVANGTSPATGRSGVHTHEITHLEEA